MNLKCIVYGLCTFVVLKTTAVREGCGGGVSRCKWSPWETCLEFIKNKAPVCKQQSLRFILCLRLYSSFITSRPGLFARNHVVVAADQGIDAHIIGQAKSTMIA